VEIVFQTGLQHLKALGVRIVVALFHALGFASTDRPDFTETIPIGFVLDAFPWDG
jgi:hypothetical protein